MSETFSVEVLVAQRHKVREQIDDLYVALSDIEAALRFVKRQNPNAAGQEEVTRRRRTLAALVREALKDSPDGLTSRQIRDFANARGDRPFVSGVTAVLLKGYREGWIIRDGPIHRLAQTKTADTPPKSGPPSHSAQEARQ